MSTAVHLADAVKDIQRAHYHDGDGGYAAVEAICTFWRRLEPDERERLKSVLVDFVARREPSLWSLAWEALVQEKALDVASEVFDVLRSQQFDVEWSDEIVLGLFRLGYHGEVNYYRRYVSDRWVQAGTLALPLVAALARVASDDSIDLAAAYIVEAKLHNVGKRVEGCVPTFVRHYLAVDEHLLARLVAEVKNHAPVVAKWFADALNKYLAKPWMLKELGDQRSASLRAEIIASAGVTN